MTAKASWGKGDRGRDPAPVRDLGGPIGLRQELASGYFRGHLCQLSRMLAVN